MTFELHKDCLLLQLHRAVGAQRRDQGRDLLRDTSLPVAKLFRVDSEGSILEHRIKLLYDYDTQMSISYLWRSKVHSEQRAIPQSEFYRAWGGNLPRKVPVLQLCCWGLTKPAVVDEGSNVVMS